MPRPTKKKAQLKDAGGKAAKLRTITETERTEYADAPELQLANKVPGLAVFREQKLHDAKLASNRAWKYVCEHFHELQHVMTEDGGDIDDPEYDYGGIAARQVFPPRREGDTAPRGFVCRGVSSAGPVAALP